MITTLDRTSQSSNPTMRLLKLNDDGSISLNSFSTSPIPPYAILSHTWGRDQDEVSFTDIMNGTGTDKSGYQKLRFCGKQARADSLHYFWVDTCCIDKSNEMELRTAINSMFKWYHNAERCYAYLYDVLIRSQDGEFLNIDWYPAFRNSRWFTRGWTLQELLAPRLVEFYSRDHIRLGDKHSLEEQIARTTGISTEALRGRLLSEFTVEERFSWTENRQTTVEEDKAYCLLGIFGVFIPLIYGEGHSNAVRRLRREIRESIGTDLQLTGPQQQTVTAESVRPLSGNNQPERSYQTHTPIEESNTDAMNEQVPRRLLPAYHEQQLEGAQWAYQPAFSPNGKLVAAGHQPIYQPGSWGETRDESHFSLWDIATGRKQRFRVDVENNIYGRAFSPDSSLIALCAYKLAGVWEVGTGRAKWMLEDVSFNLFDFAFSPDGNLIAGACNQGTIRLWDAARGGQRRRLKSDSDESLTHIEFSPNGELIASGGGFNTVYLWNVATGHIAWRLEGHPKNVMSIAFSPDSRLIACGSHGDTTVRLWDSATGAMLRRLEYRSSSGYKGIRDIAFSPDCRLIACCGTWEDDAPVQLWDFETEQERRLGVYKGTISGLAFSSEGRLIAICSYKSNDEDRPWQGDVKIQQWDVSGLNN